MTRLIYDELKRVTIDYRDIEVRLLGRHIDWKAGGAEVALHEGNSSNALIVVWGDYDVTKERAVISTHVELTKRLPNLDSLATAADRESSVSDLERFVLQRDASKHVGFITAVILGVARYETKDYAGAEHSFNKALGEAGSALEPYEKALVLFHRGTTFFARGSYDEAIRDLSEVIAIDPTFARAFNNRGVADAAKNNLPAAIADFTKAIALNPELTEAYRNRARAYERMGCKDLAAPDEIKLRSAPQSPRPAEEHYFGPPPKPPEPPDDKITV